MNLGREHCPLVEAQSNGMQKSSTEEAGCPSLQATIKKAGRQVKIQGTARHFLKHSHTLLQFRCESRCKKCMQGKVHTQLYTCIPFTLHIQCRPYRNCCVLDAPFPCAGVVFVGGISSKMKNSVVFFRGTVKYYRQAQEHV